MKAVMLSIQPKWCGLIASGKKTIEVRKTKPKLDAPFKCYIYCTNEKKLKFWTNKRYSYADDHSHNLFDRCGNGKVIGEFICDTMVVDKTYGHDPMFREMACMSQVEAASYCLNAKMYGWHISELKIYDEPKPLYDFYKPGALSEYDLDDNICNYCVDTEHGKYRMVGSPDGPLMCEGRFCGAAYQEYLDEEFQMTRPPQSWCYVEEV